MRPRLPDAAARKQLATLLLLRLKLPGEHGTVAKEVVSLVVETQDSQQLQEAFGTMEEPDIVTLLSSLDEMAVNQLHVAMQPCHLSCRGLVDKELARRLASRLNEEHLKTLWQLLRGHLDSEQDSWAQAAGCLLSAQMGRMEVQLHNLSLEVLVKAGKFMDDQDSAIAFAQDFFGYDLGISMAEQWPLKSSAPIFHELAGHLSQEKSEERLRLLLRAYDIDESDSRIRASLYTELCDHMLSQEAGGAFAMEGLLLKLGLEEGGVPKEVLEKLTLNDHHLIQASPDQLMILSQQLADSDRPADGGLVAVFAAKAFVAKGHSRQSEEAFLKAFALDRSNQEAAEGLAKAVSSAHKRCEELESRCDVSDERSGVLEAKCQALEKRCADLESQRSSQPSQVIQLHSCRVWDLSGYDFSGFCKGQCQKSEKFQLGSSAVTAWLELYPKGHSNSSVGRAGLYLHVDKPAMVKWTWQSGSGEVKISERDFSKARLTAGGTPDGWGNTDFMPISETNGSVTLHILSVQLPGSALRFADVCGAFSSRF